MQLQLLIRIFIIQLKQESEILYKLKIIPNFVDIELYKTSSSICLPKIFKKLNGRTDIVYAGNIGNAQEWDLVIKLANDIKKFPIAIWIIGKG